jgi:hypothetical protein
MAEGDDGVGSLARNDSDISLDRCQRSFEEKIIGSALSV